MSSGYEPNKVNSQARKRTTRSTGGAVSNYSKETTEEVLGYPIMAVPNNSITLRAARYFKIRSTVSEKDGKTITATYYPNYNKYGKLTGFKKRDWTIPKEEKFHFTTVGSVSPTNQLFGQKEASLGSGKKSLAFLEGEGDLCAAFECYVMAMENMASSNHQGVAEYANKVLKGVELISNNKLPGQNPVISIASLNSGCASAINSVASNEKFIRSYDNLVIAFDNDKATPLELEKGAVKGVEATDKVATYLLEDNVYLFKYPCEVNDPEGPKDIRDLYDLGKYQDIYKGLTKPTQKYVPDKLIGLADIDISDLRKKKKDGVPLPEMPELFNLTKGPRTGELWTLTGPSGGGKTTVARKVTMSIIDYLRKDEIPKLDDYSEKEKCALIFLEEDEDETVNALYAEELGVDAKEFVADPEQFITEAQHSKIHNQWIKENKVKVFDHFGSIPIEDLIDKLKQMVFLDGCRWIVLDHLSMVISGLRTDNERKMIDIVMTELAAFCKQYDVFILLISHMKRKEIILPKDLDGVPQPLWYPVRKEDLRGSAALEQLSWIVLGVEPEELPDRSRGRCRTVVLKNRPHKKLGITDTFTMDEQGKFQDASLWEWTATGFHKKVKVVNRKY